MRWLAIQIQIIKVVLNYDLKSISNYIFMLVGGAVSWKSIKQALAATSTMQAKYIIVHEATFHASNSNYRFCRKDC